MSADIEFVILVSTDELVYPGGHQEFGLQSTLTDLASNRGWHLLLPTYDGIPESTDIKEPFLEVNIVNIASATVSLQDLC